MIKGDFNFDNISHNQAIVWTIDGVLQELMVLRFNDNGTYELKKKDIL
jgi:hypothetical protein